MNAMSNNMGNSETGSSRETRRETRKPSRFRWLLDESIFQGLLLAGVVFVLVDGFMSIGRPPIA
jgi:hypothetical protein